VGAKRVVVWRHGQTHFNKTGRMQGQRDVPLDADGLEQAAAAAQELAQLKPAKIISSDLQRASVTAQALGDLAGVPVQVDPRLRERGFGLWEDLTFDDIAARWPEEHQRWRRGEEVPSVAMEPRAAVAVRALEAVQEAVAAVNDDELIVVATHGATAACIVTGLLELDPTTWHGFRSMSNAHWALLERSQRSPGWFLYGYNLGPSPATEPHSRVIG
jgi:probable phosphoglycerate mutase